ncbi:MAG: hypothetical protein E7672_08290 [Ruminococcaceae bacterium]|nr:hypothetical protein [Oscillospiraceae bacterium]
MTEAILKKISSKYPLTEIDTEGMSSLKANGMTFTVKAYKADGLGHVSVMRANGFFGLMKMDTLIINPDKTDLPLYSYDRIFAMGNDTLIVELYDTTLSQFDDRSLESVKNEFTFIPERDPGEHWYDSIKLSSSISKKGKRKQTKAIDELALNHFESYLSSECGKVDDVSAKREKAAVYVDGLLKNGGPSTDVFKKELGEEKTEQLFRKFLFGIE